jgi:hypothetical protein
MSYFAYVPNIVDGKGIVEQVIRIDQDTLESGQWGDPFSWIQTSYNTHGNQHPENRPLRGNYAGIGFTYDASNDVFYPPQPFASWTLNQSTWEWNPPVKMPNDGKQYAWNEKLINWEETFQIDVSKKVN